MWRHKILRLKVGTLVATHERRQKMGTMIGLWDEKPEKKFMRWRCFIVFGYIAVLKCLFFSQKYCTLQKYCTFVTAIQVYARMNCLFIVESVCSSRCILIDSKRNHVPQNRGSYCVHKKDNKFISKHYEDEKSFSLFNVRPAGSGLDQ